MLGFFRGLYSDTFIAKEAMIFKHPSKNSLHLFLFNKSEVFKILICTFQIFFEKPWYAFVYLKCVVLLFLILNVFSLFVAEVRVNNDAAILFSITTIPLSLIPYSKKCLNYTLKLSQEKFSYSRKPSVMTIKPAYVITI